MRKNISYVTWFSHLIGKKQFEWKNRKSWEFGLFCIDFDIEMTEWEA